MRRTRAVARTTKEERKNVPPLEKSHPTSDEEFQEQLDELKKRHGIFG